MPANDWEVPIVAAMARNVASAARGAANMTTSAARHAVWYVRYQVDGSSRAQKAPARPRGRRS